MGPLETIMKIPLQDGIDIRQYLASSKEIVIVSQAELNPATSALLAALARRYTELDRRLKFGARISDNAKEDFRHVLGEMASLSFVTSLPHAARELLSEQDQ